LLRDEGLAASRRALADGLVEAGPYGEGRAVLTLRGRLLADGVVRDLVD
ncbi:coproporphyrinogen III oxidase, partial [Streptomyces sp. NPDC006265]